MSAGVIRAKTFGSEDNVPSTGIGLDAGCPVLTLEPLVLKGDLRNHHRWLMLLCKPTDGSTTHRIPSVFTPLPSRARARVNVYKNLLDPFRSF